MMREIALFKIIAKLLTHGAETWSWIKANNNSDEICKKYKWKN